MTSVRAVLFDMDGVLVDSFEMWYAVMNEVARDLGCPPIDRPALEAAFGQGVEEDLATFYRGVTRERLDAAYAAALPRHAGRMVANPEAGAVFASLAERGIGRAVVSNTSQDALPAALAACGLGDACDVVVGTRPGIAEKPAPDLLLEACRALGVEARDALMVGDTAYDAQAAAAAGTAYLAYVLRDGGSLLAAVAERT